VIAVLADHANKEKQTDLARRYGIAKQTVYSIGGCPARR
jgi:hypothetical protein